jgi:two-component system response regulator YesN
MYRVLLADDEANVIKVLRMLIDWGKYGFEVAAEASDGAEALEKMDSVNPDLVITDVDMPRLNGIQLIRRIADGNYGCKTLLLTVYKDFQYIKSAMNCGAMGYLLKPVDEGELAESLLRVKRELDAAGPGAEAARAYGGHEAAAEGGALSPSAPFAPYKARNVLAEAAEYIRLNYRKDLTLKGLAERFYMNPLYLGQLLKKETGESFNDYLARVRVENAVRLLENTNLKVREIAEKVGFKEIQYFYKIFKHVAGKNPSAYRKTD